MRKFLFILMILAISSRIYAQQSEYLEGYYYNTSGQKITGLLKFSPAWSLLHFKANKEASSEKIRIKDISSVVMLTDVPPGKDSLAVLTEDNKSSKLYFGKLMQETPVTKFYYKYYEIHSGGMPSMTSYNVPNSTNNGSHSITHWSVSAIYSGTGRMIMYQDGNTTYELTKKNFFDIITKAFADQPFLVQQIQSKRDTYKDLNDIFERYRRQRDFDASNPKK
jgi:hypothetical protein